MLLVCSNKERIISTFLVMCRKGDKNETCLSERELLAYLIIHRDSSSEDLIQGSLEGLL